MTTVDEMRAAITERLDAGDRALDSLAADGPRLVLQVVDASLAPQGVEPAVRAQIASRIVEVLVRAIAHGRKTLAFQRKLAGALGSPDELRAAAALVALSVTAPAKELAPQLDGSSLEATNPEVWSSNERYAAAVDGQRGALDRVPEAAETLERALTTMSDGIDQYYTSLTQLVTTTSLTLLGLATTITTWETAVGGILGITSSLVTVESGLATMYQAAVANTAAVDELLTSASTLEWPTGSSSAS